MIRRIALQCIAMTALLTLAMSSFATGSAAGAQTELEDLERITQAALTHLRSESGEQSAQLRALPLDPRLRLKRCEEPLRAESASHNAGRIAVRVSCSGPQPWRLYVRIEARRLGTVVVATRHLGAGTLLQAGDLRREERDLSRLPMGYAVQTREVIGRRLQRALRAGEAIPTGALARELLVKNGDPVTIVSGGAGYEISMRGTALRDGRQGARISVRNSSSGRIVQGHVIDRGRVQIGGGPVLPRQN